MHARISSIVFVSSLFISISYDAWAQGPLVSYYYNQSTELTFASCILYQEGGSRQKIPFLPVVSRNFQRTPLGTKNYSQDVHVKGPIVFIGNGIVVKNQYNSYVGRRRDYTSGEIDVAGKIVMFYVDFPDSVGEKHSIPLENRISQAASRKAAGVILFSSASDYPFLYAQFKTESEIPNIPVVTISKLSAVDILFSAGEDGNALFEEWEKMGEPPMSRELISKLELKIEGWFDKVESDHFLFRFRGKVIPKNEMKALVETNEKAVKFIFDYFEALEKPKWERKMNVYFRDFDSKIFYTHHWGGGLACNEGVFMVHPGGVPNFGMAVHENTHIYTYLNWSDESTSFMSEGIAKHVEAMATDTEKNHRMTVEFLKLKELFPLEELLTHNIGMSGAKTTVGYPASGSFSGFLIEKFGMNRFKDAYILESRSEEGKERENTWIKAFGKSLEDLEKEWLSWLGARYELEKKDLDSHFQRIREQKRIQEEKEALKPKPEEWPCYVGTYEWKEMGRTFEIQIVDGDLIMTSADMPDLKIRLIPVVKHGFRMKGGPVDGEVLIFQFNEEGKVEKANLGAFHFVRSGEQKSDEFIWGNLRNMGPNINSAGKDEHVTFTQDGETMYFASIREGGMGNYDIYMSKFENGEWSGAELLPSPINTERDEFDVFVSLDGNKLFFASNRDNEDPYWNCDIYVSEWQGNHWGEPKIFDSTFVTPGKPDWGAAFPRDFKTFIFSSGKEPAKKGMVQILQSLWLGENWSEPQLLLEPVNTGGWEATPYLTPDGKTLYLNSGRGREDKKDVDIWKFEHVSGEWTNAELMDGPFRSNKHDYDPCLSPDGEKFYFTSNRDGGLGDSDIWVVEKVYKKQNPYAAFLRETAHLDFTHPVFTEVLSEITDDDMSLEQKLEVLFYFTRDSISFVPDASLYGSEALEKRKAICYTKAMVYVSFCRLMKVPARLAWIKFVFPRRPKPALHGIVKIYYNGRWIYVDTVSNCEAWSYWDKKNAHAFQPPEFSLEHNVIVDKRYIADFILGDYETNDVPELWLDSMRQFGETGSW